MLQGHSLIGSPAPHPTHSSRTAAHGAVRISALLLRLSILL